MIWSARTLAVTGEQTGFQLDPSQTATKSALASPPALVNCPPTYTLPVLVSTAIASTPPLRTGAPTECQELPSQRAIEAAVVSPPALVNTPPA